MCRKQEGTDWLALERDTEREKRSSLSGFSVGEKE